MTPLSTAADATLLDLYAGAAEPALWTRALDRLCADTGACSAVVQAFSFDGGRARIHWLMQDSRTGAQRALPPGSVVLDGNPRLARDRALRGLNRIARDEELFDPGDEARPHLQQQLATLGLGRFIGTLQEVSNGVFLGLALHRPVGDHSDFSAAQVGRLASVAPHIGQAFVLTERLRATLLLDEQMCAHFNRLRCGLVICDRAGQVKWLNDRADALLRRGGPLQLGASGLRARSNAETDMLLRELAAAGAAGGPGVRYLRLGHGAETLHVAVQAAAQPSTVMLVLTPAQGASDISPNALVKMFDLTPAEARLVGALVTGTTLEQYATHRGISIGTARGQLKQVQAKTGARRQPDLVRMVLTSAAAHLLSPGDHAVE
ncbi:helix-turn-helix transcriptional regulator [Ideonella sp.]|uniref:helix-turn-helix transcriptional regulator n=1 Tax=Ideonella sp. TaxID=1929293 RepID=UPI002B488B5F|nr:helix-turn-helix transcriptional regulator [Ideonella sp.]HJV68845.1 helix-turn-helix transcriptional regulator [Ideonella sp.]